LSPCHVSRRRLAVLCLSAQLWAFSFGLGAPLASLWLQDKGHGPIVIGWNTGVYYLGIALAAVLVPWLMRRSARSCLVVGMLASAATVAAFPWGGGLVGWFVLRLLNGVAGAMSLIPLETLINRNAVPEQRSRDFGYYAFNVALGMALGTLLGTQLYPTVPHTAFLCGGLAALLATVIVWAWLHLPVFAAEPRHERTPLAFGRNFLSFGSAWSQGFLEGGMVALMPIYLLGIGLSDTGVGWLMSSIMIGVIVFQVPVAWLADRLGRTAVLLACYGVTAAALAALACGIGWPSLTLCLFLAGACSGAFYPLGLALLGERLPASGLSRASAWYLAINCVGSWIGPTVAGTAMEWYGNGGMFLTGEAAVIGVVVLWAAWRFYERLDRPADIPEAPLAERQAA
jgi:MFS family permease